MESHQNKATGVLRISLGMSSTKISKFGSNLDPTSSEVARARVDRAGGRVCAGGRVGAAGGRVGAAGARVGACFRVDFSVPILIWIFAEAVSAGCYKKHSSAIRDKARSKETRHEARTED